MTENMESISPSSDEQVEAYLAGLPIPDNMPEDVRAMFQERVDRIREARGF